MFPNNENTTGNDLEFPVTGDRLARQDAIVNSGLESIERLVQSQNENPLRDMKNLWGYIDVLNTYKSLDLTEEQLSKTSEIQDIIDINLAHHSLDLAFRMDDARVRVNGEPNQITKKLRTHPRRDIEASLLALTNTELNQGKDWHRGIDIEIPKIIMASEVLERIAQGRFDPEKLDESITLLHRLANEHPNIYSAIRNLTKEVVASTSIRTQQDFENRVQALDFLGYHDPIPAEVDKPRVSEQQPTTRPLNTVPEHKDPNPQATVPEPKPKKEQGRGSLIRRILDKFSNV